MQFTDPSDGTDFAYVGTRATGTQAGDYLITGPGWTGQVPGGMTQIASPNNSALVFGRVLVQRQRPVDRVWSCKADTTNTAEPKGIKQYE